MFVKSVDNSLLSYLLGQVPGPECDYSISPLLLAFWNSAGNRRRVLAMNIWLTVRTFIALVLILLGIGLMFVRSEDSRMLLGAVLAGIGLTFVLRMALALRQR